MEESAAGPEPAELIAAMLAEVEAIETQIEMERMVARPFVRFDGVETDTAADRIAELERKRMVLLEQITFLQPGA